MLVKTNSLHVLTEAQILRYSSEFKARFFVYCLIKEGKIVYVGQTKNYISRLATHKKDKDFDRFTMIECETHKKMCELESLYISRYRPVYNKALFDIEYSDPVSFCWHQQDAKTYVTSCGRGMVAVEGPFKFIPHILQNDKMQTLPWKNGRSYLAFSLRQAQAEIESRLTRDARLKMMASARDAA